MLSPFSKETLSKQLASVLEFDMRIAPKDATLREIYGALSTIIVRFLKEKRHKFLHKANSEGQKQVYYISMEFLMGRSLKTNLFNLGLNETIDSILKEEYGVDSDSLYEEEPDAGLGNGGLGRLAACYLDGLATKAYHAVGYSLLYEYGIFKQKIVDGWQTELPDDWLPGGGVWLTEVQDQKVEVRFDGTLSETWTDDFHSINHIGYTSVYAIPYDMYVSGYDSPGVSKLRLWRARSVSFDMAAFNSGNYAGALGGSDIANSISKVLYPNDNHAEGKALRLRQEYFMCAAAIGDITLRHMKVYGTLENLHEKVAIHINDTHPTLAIPELMRVLLDECGCGWSQSWHIVTNTFAFTNHTVMAEALETWDRALLQKIVPRIFNIICEINRRFCEEISKRTEDDAKVERLSIVTDTNVKMANLCVEGSHSVNGVSKLHSDIIKKTIFAVQYEDNPHKFTNVTNGIAYRRWLIQSNPGLTELLSDTIGDGFKKNGAELSKFLVFRNDKAVLERLAKIKRANKVRLANYVKRNNGFDINPDSIFDAQVKRLHEYKRQQLNVMNIIADYLYLLENPNAKFTPKTYFFASKAAPGYYIAKQIIKLIWYLGEEIRRNKAISDKLQVVFLENYCVSLSEILMPASEISEQISLAGTEASGTGNMKFMINGALTVGTFDGANVEMSEAVGLENIYIFGMRASEATQRLHSYKPDRIYEQDKTIRAVMDFIYKGVGGVDFTELANAIRHKDAYMCFADFNSYRNTQKGASLDYADLYKWNEMSLANIAGAGVFSADRAVTEYVENIWHL